MPRAMGRTGGKIPTGVPQTHEPPPSGAPPAIPTVTYTPKPISAFAGARVPTGMAPPMPGGSGGATGRGGSESASPLTAEAPAQDGAKLKRGGVVGKFSFSGPDTKERHKTELPGGRARHKNDGKFRK
jgi:hypothetical protein